MWKKYGNIFCFCFFVCLRELNVGVSRRERGIQIRIEGTKIWEGRQGLVGGVGWGGGGVGGWIGVERNACGSIHSRCLTLT